MESGSLCGTQPNSCLVVIHLRETHRATFNVRTCPQAVFGVPVLQGYGMTENAGAAVVMPKRMRRTGTVGGPLPCVEVRVCVFVNIMGLCRYTHA